MTEPPLPLPVTTRPNVPRWIGHDTAPLLLAFTAGLVAVATNQPKAELLFVCAGIVSVGLYFVDPPEPDNNIHPILFSFLQRLPGVLTAASVILVVLGLGFAFPNEVALIPLFVFVSLAALAVLFGVTLGPWTTATLYTVALASLVAFIVLASIA